MVWKKFRWNVINEVDNVTREELMLNDYVIICCKPIIEQVTLCEIECIDSTEDTINIVGIYFSYNKKLEQEINILSHIGKIHLSKTKQKLSKTVKKLLFFSHWRFQKLSILL